MLAAQDYQVVALKNRIAFKFLNFVSKCIAPTRGVYVIMPGLIFAPSLVAGMDETAV
jgi:hypothetical protein